MLFRPKHICSVIPLESKMSTQLKPIENAIRDGLTDRLVPVHLQVVNESYMHNVPKGAETHFKVLVVSERFEGLPLIKVEGIYSTENHLTDNVYFRDIGW